MGPINCAVALHASLVQVKQKKKNEDLHRYYRLHDEVVLPSGSLTYVFAFVEVGGCWRNTSSCWAKINYLCLLQDDWKTKNKAEEPEVAVDAEEEGASKKEILEEQDGGVPSTSGKKPKGEKAAAQGRKKGVKKGPEVEEPVAETAEAEEAAEVEEEAEEEDDEEAKAAARWARLRGLAGPESSSEEDSDEDADSEDELSASEEEVFFWTVHPTHPPFTVLF